MADGRTPSWEVQRSQVAGMPAWATAQIPREVRGHRTLVPPALYQGLPDPGVWGPGVQLSGT